MNSRAGLMAKSRRHTTPLAVFVALCAAGVARADVPRLSADNAAQLVGKDATLDIVVVSLKFAERRQMQFLSSSANFRGRSNLAVAIRKDDLANFERAGIDDLKARYENRRIRASGRVVRDEGQVLLLVHTPDQIEVLGPAPETPPKDEKPRTLVVVNERGDESTFNLPLEDSLPRQSLRVEHEGEKAVYAGVALAAVLERADVELGQDARGRRLARYVVVSARDDYAVVFSVAEVDPYLSPQTILLAETVDGHPMAPNEGPLLVVSGDKHQRRWVRQIARIEVRSALAGSDRKKKEK